MLQTIREHTQGWIAGIIISIVILTFALWGIHSYFEGGAGNNIVAEVNGISITKGQLAGSYERLRRQVQTQIGSNVNLAKDEGALKNRALQALVDAEVLKQASVAQGFLVSSSQVDGYLQNMPEFQVDGEFSLDRFQELLSSSLLSTSEFLDIIRTTLLVDQPKLGLLFTSFALPDEVDYTIALVNQEREFDYINIPFQAATAATVVVAPDKINAFYEEHKNDFMTPEQVSVEYVQLSLKDLSATINPTDAMLKNFYNENINAYTQQPMASKKLAGQEPKIQTYEMVKDKVKEAYIRQHAEEKFAQLRDQLSEVTYEHPDSLKLASSTLNLPIQTSDLFVKDKNGTGIAQFKKIRDIAFSNDVLNLQNNSDVIQINPETVIVLRVKSHVASALLPLADVSKQIEDKLKARAVEELVAKAAQDAVAQLNAGADPAKLAADKHYTWTKAGLMGRYSNKVDSAILDTVFRLPNPAMQKGGVYGLTRVPNGYAIVAVKSVKEGVVADAKQYQVFAEQVQYSEGLLEYMLYKQSEVNQAKVKLIEG